METFLYLNLGYGRVTIAINKEGSLIQIAAAFCSPNDQFVKLYGRKLALERLNNKKDFYVCFEQKDFITLKKHISIIMKFIISEKWVSKLDIENELDIIVHEIITETISDSPDDIIPMTVHTNIIPIWAKRATRNFFTGKEK